MFLYGRINGIRPEERIARIILDHELDIHVSESECPDLQNESIGIEVTRAFPDWYCKAEGNYTKYKQACDTGNIESAKFYFSQSFVNTGEAHVDITVDANGNINRQVTQTCSVFDTDLEEVKFAIDRKNAKAMHYGTKPLQLYIFALGGFSEDQYGTFVGHIRDYLWDTKSPFETMYIHQIRTRKLLIISQNQFEIKDLDMDYYMDKLHW